MVGVPASLITAISFPVNKVLSRCEHCFFSWYLSNLIRGVEIENTLHKFFDTRVSSAAIKDTCFKMSINRLDVSSRLPIGVAHIKQVPNFLLI